MQMRSSGPTCCAHGTDDLPLRNSLAFFDIDARQVCVNGQGALGMFDEDHIAKTLLITSTFHKTLAHRSNSRTGRGCVVHTKMGFPDLQNGVHAHAKTTGHTRKSQGRGQESSSEVRPIHGVVIAFGLMGLRKPNGLIGLAAVDELGIQYFADFEDFTICKHDFIDQRETVALSQSPMKINVSRENLGQLGGNGIGHSCLICGLEQGGLDAPARDLELGLKSDVGVLDLKATRIAFERQAVEVIGVFVTPTHAQLLKTMGLIAHRTEQALMFAKERLLGAGRGQDEGQGLGVMDAKSLEGVLSGVVAAGPFGGVKAILNQGT